MLVTPHDHRIVDVDPGFTRLFGHAGQRIVGQRWDLLHAPGEDAARGRLHEIAAEIHRAGVWSGELQSRRQDGSAFAAHVSIAACDHAVHGPVWIVIYSDRTSPAAADAALRRRQERLHLATGVAAVGVWEWDLRDGSIFWDERMFEMFDIMPTANFRYELWSERLHPEDRAHAEQVLGKLLQASERVSCEYRIVHRDGSIRHIQAEGKSWADEAGHVLRAVGVNIDITERKRVEVSLRESQAKFAKAFYRAPVFMSITTLDTGTYVDVNEHCEVLTGFHREEMIGRSSVEIGLISAADRLRLATAVAREGRVSDFELPFRRKDGVPGCSRVHAECLTLGDRRCLLLIALDVTESRKVDEQLRQLSQAVEQSPSAVVITDPSGRIEYVNPKFCQVTGYTSTEVMGRNPRFLKSGETPPHIYQKLWQTITAGGTWRGVFHNRGKSGSSYWEDATISPIRDAAGRITHFLAVKEDLTARKLLEERYRQAQKMEAVGQLAGGVAHDYNNILTATLMQLHLLQEDPDLTTPVRAALQELEKLAGRSARLTRQLLTFSRQHPLDVEPLDLDELLGNLLGMLRPLLGEQIRLEYHRAAAPLWTMADTGMIEQMVTNLAVNARDAMAPRGGTLVIRAEHVLLDGLTAANNPDAYAGDFVCLSVTDTGCGMSLAVQKRIFEPFFTTKEIGKGTGLGLATVFGIVQQHRGWVEVESVVGQGSTFRVYLPSSPAPKLAAIATPAERPLRGTETILLVEDEPLVRDKTAAGLRSYGYEVVTAASGPEALVAWEKRAGQIDLLVTDMVMPHGLSGLELAVRLRANKPDLPVVICSGYSRELSDTGLSQVPGAVYLPKPFELPKLGALARGLFDSA